MRLARISTAKGIFTGEYDDGVVYTEGDGEAYTIGEDAELMAPCDPDAIFCTGRNFGAKIEQMGEGDLPDRPDWFIKPPHALHPPNQPIEYPEWMSSFTYAGELAAVIGERCHDLTVDEVDDALLGYTILNDLDAYDQDRRTARKTFDGSAPLGPWIETDVDLDGMAMETVISGEQRQSAATDEMIFHPEEIVAFLSERYTFRPGDVISFGSPANPGLLEPGDTVEITYEGVGTLRNEIVEP
ncbi:fumarylacetoacetate hydrolase family protein [Haloplanus aerogenes]|uniref:2-keto-4-pentenoate hydratase/2-oxohepta-3-ene-1,7-dioic acid hydratase in catechol pathway n=1 Tax=Haloplanus aerogenes TaxID=660522 RepID=A0A3M0CTS8_9EURY|nr:fumarylacetoacetate hydrolase family protein [Haloplanus aerogenes]AZH26610.1 FAA hydrolase family protein [Haloplanus aerogenes]RMB12842.1 2-keto-4-pentenoate hydratase/2-oxohepta-3-ene-1,7-dioic acid hydratase in catechol pathway [Haloplanus aerogenes]